MYTRKYRYVLRVSTNYKENKERCKQEISKWGGKKRIKDKKENRQREKKDGQVRE